MGSQGTTTVNFGSFPGSASTSVAVTGQGAIIGSSLVEAWIFPSATADHTADEHVVDAPVVTAGNVVSGTGFTIYAQARDGIPVPDAAKRSTGLTALDSLQEQGRAAPMPYGLWTVAWAWN